ncbi:hypothetical protein L1987_40854 [Smallanthus sonchifolius]|uniref:Uncharacterized protein n=1 Tax=Smallanthus sonchifolius TaxID=185202 RepID=A0ACB9GUT1_9ASTR|nr:hypothetical protein L1987_40854 [Smallanthus sonchifolius]
MYGWSHTSVRENKSIRKSQSPSFSSSLLDEIYRSMDVGDDKPGEFKLREAELSRKPSVSGGGSGGSGRAPPRSAVEDEGISSLRRAVLVQEWVDIKLNAKNLTRQAGSSSLLESNRKSVIDNGRLFFDSVSRSSNSSSCFGPFRPKQVRTGVSFKKHQQMENDYCFGSNHANEIVQGPLIKSKARALKIYANMKKVKQPISPGGRLTTFLNSLFTNSHLTKPKDMNEEKIERTSKSTHVSACSSTSSFTKSCLSKNSPRSREKINNGMRRTVRFYPVSLIIDEDCRPCGEKFISADFNDEEDEECNADDMTSDTSSDLFELDHLSILQECDELPVYETTHFGTNCAIANGLIG